MDLVNFIIYHSDIFDNEGAGEEPLVINFTIDREIFVADGEKYVRAADVENAARASVREYLVSDEGKAQLEENGGKFSWNDAVLYVPDSFWAKHGLYKRDYSSYDADVAVEDTEDLTETLLG